jgi:hypothetical protein
VKWLEEQGLLFVGSGVSGGEEGALKGPSLMPGGSKGVRIHFFAQPLFVLFLNNHTITHLLDDLSHILICLPLLGSGMGTHSTNLSIYCC